ncbi:MAG: AMP-binding protein [Alcanivoracaceae bacterium]|nr:AMP-binding protein [Alcanivoracaceae bacterium]
MNLSTQLRVTADRFAQRIALDSRQTGALTFQTLDALLTNGRQHLANLGICQRNKVAVLMPSGGLCAVTQLLCISSAVSIPLNTSFIENELSRLTREIKPDILLTDDDESAKKYSSLLGIRCAAVAINSEKKEFSFTAYHPNVFRSEDVSASHPYQLPPNAALILLTSGSTGVPKWVPLTHDNLIGSAQNLQTSLFLTEYDTCLNMMPMFHVGALVDLLIAPLLSGGQVVLEETFDARKFFHRIKNSNITWFQGVPTMLGNILDFVAEQKIEIATNELSLRLIRSVSSALPLKHMDSIEEIFRVPVIEIYGMSETSGLICSNPLPPKIRKPLSVGVPYQTQLRIIDANGDELTAGDRGEICVRGDTVTSGYLNTKNSIDDGWLATGDEGYVDEDGYLYLTGRIKEVINRGGEKISPLEIDRFTAWIPGIREAAAFSFPHPTLNEDVALAVVTDKGAEIADDDIRRFLSAHLASFKVPRKIIRVSELPRAAGGKLQRHKLIDLYRAMMVSSDQQDNPPLSDDQKIIGKFWQQVLQSEALNQNSNFFDLGGDSLKSIWLVERLKKAGFKAPSAALLYDRPTLEGFTSALLNADAELEKDLPTGVDVELPTAIAKNLKAFMSSWTGIRQEGTNYLVGRNTTGRKPPVFWCVNANAEFDVLARALGDQQPVYGMRSLYQVSDRHPSHIPLVAQDYIADIKKIQPKGPYYLGGFCEGAKFAFEIARQLKGVNEEVGLLALQDQFVAMPYDGKVALYMCRPSPRAFAADFAEPEILWRSYYGDNTLVHQLNSTHGDCYGAESTEEFVKQLRLDLSEAQRRDGDTSSPASGFQPTELIVSGRAEISVVGPRISIGDKNILLRVKVRNIGGELWQPAVSSRIMLGCRWLDRKGKSRGGLAGFVGLDKALKPGASTQLVLKASVPKKVSLRTLEINVFQDGFKWFSDHGSDGAQRRIMILNS